MCYAIPGKVVKIEDRFVTVEYFGEIKKAINELEDLKVGDYIYAQGGFVINKISKSEAKEILKLWEELFFRLKEIDNELTYRNQNKLKSSKETNRKLSSILDRASQKLPLKKEELIYLLKLEDENEKKLLFQTANFLRQKYLGNSCCIHGIIEFSNYCNSDCAYCGISTHNKSIERYRMSLEEIVKTAITAVEKYGFKAIVLQSGEDKGYGVDELYYVIKEIKNRVPVLIFISFGEIGIPALYELYRAGARGLLMRFETSNPQIYSFLHKNKKLEDRLTHIKEAYKMGYLIITGALIGLPLQTEEDIVNDILLAKELNAEMYSFGPFLPHPETPLKNFHPPSEELVLKTISLIRLVDPENSKILVTTAFETLSKKARENGLMSGANSLMLNLTPEKYKRLYAIYPDRFHINESLEKQIEDTLSLLKSLGRAPTDLGVS